MEEGHSEGCRRSKSFRNAASSNGPGHDNDNTNESDDEEEGRPASQENIDLAHLNFVEQREGVILCLTVRMTRRNLRHLKALAQQDHQDEDDYDFIEVELYLRISLGCSSVRVFDLHLLAFQQDLLPLPQLLFLFSAQQGLTDTPSSNLAALDRLSNTGVDMPYDSDNIKSKTANTDESVVSGSLRVVFTFDEASALKPISLDPQ
ncbi:hypothetical protein DFH05DRAFT_1520154 [Lentinula detonsa]|uniref:Uncharacterized protein n=1 Tax=Lentinula detonsa TaxID=2804962 RepID=A0A9W8U102_9AGAR|nr:hypothetical protein DFH05DRAFT_1520154 [Lentinula detonsa]